MTGDALPEEIDLYWTDAAVRTAEGESQPATERR
jgi:hypothetical protein